MKRAQRRDLERLLPLQVAYEREEVLLPGREVNVQVSRTILAESLANQLVYVADLGGEAVARVATNARGIGCDQVGGVYVQPDLRKRGIASWLMRSLIETIESEQKGITLFVKPGNAAAMNLYSALGFAVEDKFRIDYYW